jgi:hypothetical protein
MVDRPILFSAPNVATPLVWEDSKNYEELVRNIWRAMLKSSR